MFFYFGEVGDDFFGELFGGVFFCVDCVCEVFGG